ncbi:MAG: taurine dioxygenase [Myxococcales bacterium]|nr:taurine dioxygenase [Myxococcales bacterium]
MASYQRIEVRPRTRAIGADVSGVDLSGPPDDESFQELKAALHEHLVLFFHNQHISPEQHLHLARRLGRTEVHEYFPSLDGFPEISVLEHDAEHPPISDSWHSDVSYRSAPSMASVLYARTLPSHGGDTLWLSAYAAFDALSKPMQAFLTTLHAEHDFLHAYGPLLSRLDDAQERIEKARRDTPPVVHPVIVTHPVTGRRLLYVNPTFTRSIVELSRSESRAVLGLLLDHLRKPDFQVRLQWRENDVAIWDNRATQHYATADYYPEYRRMHRVTVGGDRPLGVN